jgi:hypothetical protein
MKIVSKVYIELDKLLNKFHRVYANTKIEYPNSWRMKN